MIRTVKRVIDGDTFVVGRKINGSNFVRLANVDAPELPGSSGQRAKSILANLIAEKKVSIIPVGRSYSRVVAHIRQNRFSINRKMRSRGY
jgi:endonuclease YncB( thermonuclease family)